MIPMQRNQRNTNGDEAALAEAGDKNLPLELLFAVSRAADPPKGATSALRDRVASYSCLFS